MKIPVAQIIEGITQKRMKLALVARYLKVVHEFLLSPLDETDSEKIRWLITQIEGHLAEERERRNEADTSERIFLQDWVYANEREHLRIKDLEDLRDILTNVLTSSGELEIPLAYMQILLGCAYETHKDDGEIPEFWGELNRFCANQGIMDETHTFILSIQKKTWEQKY